MLRSARKKARSAEVEITFINADMQTFELHRRFALIIMSCNSLGHLTTNDTLRECLIRIHDHLIPGGLFAFDIVNPDVRLLARSRAECVRLHAELNSSPGLAVEEVASYDPVQQVRVSQWRVRRTGAPVREIAPLQLRQFFPQEVPLLLESAGLDLACRYGDFERGPLTGESSNQICVARRHCDARAPDLVEARVG
jgi:hypothetical protein